MSSQTCCNCGITKPELEDGCDKCPKLYCLPCVKEVTVQLPYISMLAYGIEDYIQPSLCVDCMRAYIKECGEELEAACRQIKAIYWQPEGV